MAFRIQKRTTARGEARYDVRYRDVGGKVRTQTFTKEAAAKSFQRTVLADVERGEWTDPAKGRTTYAEWWDRWWPTTVNLRPSSRARDESYARNHLLPRFGSTPLAAIDHTLVAGWVAELTASGLAPATVVKAAQILSKSLTAAVRNGMIRANPVTDVDLPRIERGEMMFLTPGQVATLADAIDPRYRAWVLTAAYTGLRFGELAGLTRPRLDLLRRRLQVLEVATEVRGHVLLGPPKTRAGRRTVPLPRLVTAELEQHLGMVKGDLVFPSPEGAYLRGSGFRPRIWQPATRAAGVEGLRIHDLRHTAVSLWIAAGASPKEVAARAGHTSVVTVFDRYGHLLPGHEDNVTDALDDMAGQAQAAPNAAVRAISAR